MDNPHLPGGQQPAFPACPRCGVADVKPQSERYVFRNGLQGRRLVSVTRAFVCNGCGHNWSQHATV
jgi:hypothetical protein